MSTPAAEVIAKAIRPECVEEVRAALEPMVCIRAHTTHPDAYKRACFASDILDALPKRIDWTALEDKLMRAYWKAFVADGGDMSDVIHDLASYFRRGERTLAIAAAIEALEP